MHSHWHRVKGILIFADIVKAIDPSIIAIKDFIIVVCEIFLVSSIFNITLIFINNLDINNFR